jgi:hypothetical protein
MTGAMVNRSRTSPIRATYKCHIVRGALSATGVVVPPTENALLSPLACTSPPYACDVGNIDKANWRPAPFHRQMKNNGMHQRSPVY